MSMKPDLRPFSKAAELHEGPEGESVEARRKAAEHCQRCRSLPPLRRGEAERLVAEFLASRGSVTVCPPAYLVPVR
jgi:hypothetical protein